jgi:hypothetical protein
MNVNFWGDGKALRSIVESEERIDLERLADPGCPSPRRPEELQSMRGAVLARCST